MALAKKGTSFSGPANPGFSAPVAGKGISSRTVMLLVIGTGAFIFLVLILAVLFVFAGHDGLGVGKPSGIAIIPLKGEISNDGGGSLGSPLDAGEVVDMIEEAQGNSDVGAILLDIDSPGGEVVASKQIVYAVRGSKKPVYSYINSLGTSGAYYAAASTQYIMADRDSITGSIGVISVLPNVEGLLEKLGVRMNVLKEGEHKDIGSPFKEMTETDRQIFQSVLSQIYANFKNDVFEFRGGKITSSQLERIADGRILSGSQAYDSGLVDELVSTRKKAIERAAKLAGINNPHEVPYEKKSFGLSDLLFSAGESFGSGFVKSLRVSSSGAAQAVQLR